MSQKFTVREIYDLSKKAGLKWVDDKAPKMSAALAYNTITAIAPLLMVALLAFTIFYRQHAGEQIQKQLGNLTDPSMATALSTVIQAAMDKVSKNKSIVITLVSLLVSIFGASGVFGELQDSLNTIWGVKPIPDRPLLQKLKERLQPILLVGGIAFMLLASTIVSSLLSAISKGLIAATIGTDSYTAQGIGFFIEFVVSTVVVTTLFTAMFKVLPDVEIRFRDTLLGGFVTAILFQFGKYGLSLYMMLATPGSTFGAVGSIVAFLIWVNYSAYILFFGAEFTQVYATTYGSRIKISDNAEPVDPREAKAYKLEESDAALAAKRPVRRLPMKPRPVDPIGKKVAGTVIPGLTAVTLGRLAVKRFVARHHPEPSVTDLWKEAGRRWKDVVLLREPGESDRK